MTRSIFTLLVAVSSFGAVAAHAQPASQSIDNVYSVVDCLIERQDRRVERVLSTVPGTMDADAPWLSGAIDTCGARGRVIPDAAFYNRGAIAERLLYRDFPAIGASAHGRPARVFAPVSDYYVRYAEEYARAALGMLDMTVCVASAEPRRVYSFFRNPRGSQAERDAIEALEPAIAACIAQGQFIDLDPPVFRAFLAEAAYRVAAGQPQIFRSQQ